MLGDLLHLLRMLRRSPASALAAIVTLSLTLGAGASIFAVVDAVLLTPPPFSNPESLVIVRERPLDEPTPASRPVVFGTFEEWRQRVGSLAQLEASDGTNFTLTELGAAERISAGYVTTGFLPLLGVAPMLGRSLEEADVGRQVVLITERFWRGKLAADPNVLGRQVRLGGVGYSIIGVISDRFFLALGDNDMWLPFAMSRAQAVQSRQRVGVIARLAPGTPPAQLSLALDDISRRSDPPSRVVTIPMATALARGSTRMLALLAGAAALATLIAFTNLAGLLMVRSLGRQRELALRTALGARRFEIAKQLLLEATAIAAVGTACGVLIAGWITPAVARIALEQFPGAANRDVTVSWRIVAVVSLAATALAALFGSLPAIVSARRNVVAGLRRGVTGQARELLMRRLLVAAQVALAFVLLVSMTVVGRSLVKVLEVNPGFDAARVLALSVSLPAAAYGNGPRVTTFYSSLQRALEGRLGAGAISIADELPLTGDRERSVVSLQPQGTGPATVVRGVAPGYFDVMRIPLVSGREFTVGDNAGAQPRAVISATLAERLFGREGAVGRQVSLAGQTVEIVGVVGNVALRALDEDGPPMLYQPLSQAPSRSTRIVVRSDRPVGDVVAAVRDEVTRLDREVPVYGVLSMEEIVASSPGVPMRRVLTATFSAFALLAVVLGAIGLFGLAAHDVASRRSELALRIALGADPMRILSGTLRQGAWVVGCGLVAGALLSIWATSALGAVVFATSRFDAASAFVAAAVLIVAGAVAVLPAAVRAARTDPLIALRSE